MAIDTLNLAQTFPQIAGYKLTEQLYEGSKSCVYRAYEFESGRSVIVKLLRQTFPSFNDLLQFRNQYFIAHHLTMPGVVRPLALVPYEHSYALILEDFGGMSLQEYMAAQSPSLPEILAIAVQLAQILHELHQAHVIHKDIKPSNILIRPDTQAVKLIDFSIASLLPRETTAIRNPNQLEGTLAYLAPEQTGRMNRGLDYRADLYALGVTLFELLSGQLPFRAEEPMELVHCHLTQPPPRLTELCPDLPPVLADMVDKLLAKSAEDRYQSALGLHHDLQTCLTQWQTTGQIAAFPLAQRDRCDRFLIPEHLYGRSAEVQALLAAFDRVAAGGTELMLVAGFSGIGKSAIVNEVHKPIVRQRGYFIKGKFDQLNRNIPLSAFVQALRHLMGQLLSESDVELQQWRSQILQALGDSAQVMIEVIPELEKVLGPQPPAPALTGGAAQNRFHRLCQQFIQVFATADHPLVIFLDDLQWADAASLNLMQVLLATAASDHLLLIGAYRDHEVFAAHPLMLTLEAIAATGATCHTLTLPPLSLASVTQLVADTLACPIARAQPLADLVYQKSEGNPLFATQFLKALHDEALITFDPAIGHWQCDLPAVRRAALTSDVVDLIAQQLQKLPAATQTVLMQAVCLGNQFDLGSLAVISDQSELATADALWPALQAGLVVPQTELYKFYVGEEPVGPGAIASETVTYRFLHDRVQQAAYSLIPEAQRQATHLKIGQRLWQHTPEAVLEERIFDIVTPLNYGRDLITDPAERQALAQLNLRAGQRAKLATAYVAAYSYFQQGMQCLSAARWQQQYALTLELYVGAAEAACLKTDFETMKALCDEILTVVTDIQDQVRVYELLIYYHHTQSHFREAVSLAVDTLARLGETFPTNPTMDDLMAALQHTQQQVERVGFDHLAELPLMDNPQKWAAMRVLRSSCYPAYFAVPEMLGLLVCRLVDVTVQYGRSPLTPFAFGIYSVLLNGGVGDIDRGQQFGELAIALEQQHPDVQYRAIAYNAIYGLSRHFYRPVRESLAPLITGYQSFADNGDAESCAYCLINAFFCSVLSGQNLMDVQRQFEKYMPQVVGFKQEQVIHQLHIWSQIILKLTEPSEQPTVLQGRCFDIEAKLPQLYATENFNTINYAHTAQTILAYLLGDYERGRSHAAATAPHLGASTGKYFVAAHPFYYSLCLTALYPQATEAEQAAYTDLLAQNLERLEHLAHHCPENFGHRALLVRAEQARLQGDRVAAMELYDRAIAQADTHGFVQEAAVGNELAAQFYLAWGRPQVAAGYLQEAYYGYAHWGARTKTDALEQQYADLLKPILQSPTQSLSILETLAPLNPASALETASHNSQSTSLNLNTALDFANLLRAAQSLSATLQVDELLHQLIHLILQTSGGDRCVLALPGEVGEWHVVAIATPTTTELTTLPLTGNPDVPARLLQYVQHTHEEVVVNDLATDLPVLDDYLLAQAPKSVLGLPILKQQRLIGLVYLANGAASQVFSRDRRLVLNFLCTQAAISIENAQLYVREQAKSAQLRQSEERLKQLFEKATDAIFLLQNGSFIDCNQATVSLFGAMDKSQVCALHPAQLSPPTQPNGQPSFEQANAHIGQALTHGSNCFEWMHQRLDGTPFWAEVMLTAIPYDDEIVVHCIVRDISDRKAAETALQQKSAALETALHQLQSTQVQMIQSEKMATLGNLVAGVAHEINNPINFIYGNLKPAESYMQDLLDLVDCYQTHVPDPPSPVLELMEDIDLEFLQVDLNKLIDSMKLGADRIRQIVLSLRNFSRLDESEVKSVNLHDGLDSTLQILHHRLKATEDRPDIQVIRNYGDLPLVECYAGQLNQVFMNLLANAIDALEEANQSRTFADLKEHPNQITVTTAVVEAGQAVQIRIRDNGTGMSEAVQAKIFDHLFTTKEVGKGTGLGLAIAHSIVVDKHAGTLTVESAPGAGAEFIITFPLVSAA